MNRNEPEPEADLQRLLDGPLKDLARRGLVRLPKKQRELPKEIIKSRGSVSDLVAEQRR